MSYSQRFAGRAAVRPIARNIAIMGRRPPGFFWLFAIGELVSNKPCAILAASWIVSGDGQCRERRDENNTFLRSGCRQQTNMRTHYLSRGSATICLFYRDLGARWLTTTAGGGHRKRNNDRKRDWRISARGAPALNMDLERALGTARVYRLGLLLFGVYRKLSDQGP